MNFEEWENAVPDTIKKDSLWKVTAYRKALFLRTLALSDQLYRAVGSISANIAEGYSRGTGKDRARFYEYALGSSRESRDWYFKSRHVLGEPVVNERLDVLSEIIRLLLTMSPDQRGHVLREERVAYEIDSEKGN
ncbi:MAG: four helix bundle protein [Chloroflexi bacterium]|nr:four helix bundle protein [Chloroflexota bacterium]